MQPYKSKPVSKSSRVHDMDPDTTAFRAGWPAWLGILGSFWLVVAPFLLVYFDSLTILSNDLAVGTVGFVATTYCAFMANRSHDKKGRWFAGWLLVACGAWLVLAPFILNYSNVTKALTNDLITGVLFLILSLYGIFYHSRRFDKGIRQDPV